jgi:hypothetical protein
MPSVDLHLPGTPHIQLTNQMLSENCPLGFYGKFIAYVTSLDLMGKPSKISVFQRSWLLCSIPVVRVWSRSPMEWGKLYDLLSCKDRLKNFWFSQLHDRRVREILVSIVCLGEGLKNQKAGVKTTILSCSVAQCLPCTRPGFSSQHWLKRKKKKMLL